MGVDKAVVDGVVKRCVTGGLKSLGGVEVRRATPGGQTGSI